MPKKPQVIRYSISRDGKLYNRCIIYTSGDVYKECERLEREHPEYVWTVEDDTND